MTNETGAAPQFTKEPSESEIVWAASCTRKINGYLKDKCTSEVPFYLLRKLSPDDSARWKKVLPLLRESYQEWEITPKPVGIKFPHSLCFKPKA